MIRALILLLLPFAAQAEVVRIASYNTELSRKGPGLLLRDIRRDDPQVQAVVDVLVATQPDIVALQGIDWDMDSLAMIALSEKLRLAGLNYPHRFSAQPNSGMETGLDLDGDGRTQGPGDAQGWGQFTGQGGLAVLSRYKIHRSDIRDYSTLIWRDLPGAELPTANDDPYPSEQAQEIQRLSSTAHWVVPVATPIGRLNLMTFHASPPVFDGLEDRNGLRNRDEIRFWSLLLDGDLGPSPKGQFVIAADANQDPNQGEGHKDAIRGLLADPRLQDPQPKDSTGDTTTVQWKAVGDLRVDYVLPSADLRIQNAGVFWPDQDAALRDSAQRASRHRLVWVDVSVP
ncbi:endonuclease/exonuclease/phosphatase family protein [Rhodobacteraceae bacterium B1Z28]|uniref:Endonuclease/exonuclease/phosphatase family protein n=1 Tax=Ruegeria haliotis TaxID=2747601 RepID=A0ABX2PRY3_9RHOB|nr:endonuclease/exonuclease/phosphatase family protein [Ruegeria haliotis]NVO56778.1 endonuclease/exonuclease/phosphatase family protein [Ruegeria haliotis]